jgi:predicted porin
MFNLGDFEMKKTLVAIAALAAVSSFAQSTVTLYGIADVWFGSAKGAYLNGATCPSSTITGLAEPTGCRTGLAGDPSETKLDTGGLQGSRFGLRGSEDLGGGLKANFVFESGSNTDTGSSAQGGLLFGRQAYVGLNGGFGDVRFGRQYTAYDELRGATSAFAHTSFDTTVAGGSWARTGYDYVNRANNMIRYGTANMGGFSAAIGLGLGEDKNVSNGKAGSVISLHGLYANGPITAGIGYQSDKARTTGSAAAPKINHVLLAGAYDFGAFKLNAGFNTSKGNTAAGGAKDNELAIGGTVPIGALALTAGLSTAKTKFAGKTVEKGNSFAVQGIYALSKRTSTYFGLTNTKVKDGAGKAAEKSNIAAVGIRHTF